MKAKRIRYVAAAVAAMSLAVAACGSDDDGGDADSGDTDTTDVADDGDTGDTGGECESLDAVSLQLQWVTQAQFGGYYAAVDQGF